MSVPRTLIALVIFGLLLGTWFLVTGGMAQATSLLPSEQPAAPTEPIQLLRSDEYGIVVAVNIAGLELEQKTLQGEVYDVFSIPGFGTSSRAGAPAVPSRSVLLGIPLGAVYHLRVSTESTETVAVQHRLLPAPSPVLDLETGSALDLKIPAPGTAAWEYAEDENVYSANALYPENIATIAGSGFIRDQRYISVQLNPVQYNPVSEEAVLHKRFVVEIDFAYEQGRELGGSLSDGAFEPALMASLLNYESAANWRGKQPLATPPETLVTSSRDAALPALKIMVNQDGIYRVSAVDLAGLGVPVTTVPTTTYRLSFRGRQVPIRILESGGSFESLWFFGEKSRTKYTDTNVYRLTYDPAPPPGTDPGLRMSIRSVPASTADSSTYYSATIRLEEDLVYLSYMPWAGNPYLNPVDPWDHWFWDFTRYYEPGNPYNIPTLVFTTQISGLSGEPFTGELRGSMSGMTRSAPNPDHCVDFYVNGEWVGRHTWEGRYTEELVSYPVSSAHILEGPNAVEVQVCDTGSHSDITEYDWFELDVRLSYQVQDDSISFDVAEPGWQYRLDGFSTDAVEIFDVSETYTVTRLVDADVTFSNSLYSVAFYDVEAEQGTRYLALTRDQVKSPLSIVEEQPSNLKDPANHADYIVIAPREFVTDVQPLVDHRAAQGLVVRVVELEPIFDEFNDGIYSPEAIRSFLAYAYENWSGEPPIYDPPTYVLLVGDGTFDYKGNLGHVNPNRLPPYLAWVDPWLGETAADNRYVAVVGDDPFPDMHIGRLPAETTAQLAAMVAKTIAYETNPPPRDWVERALLVTDDPDSAGDFYAYSDDLVNNYLPEPYVPVKAYYGSTCSTGAECKQVILDTLNSTGALLVNYIGHAGVELWTGNGVWGIDDLASLVPSSRLPVMVPMTCWEGAFHQAEYDVLAEATVRIEGRGAVASWSATGEGVASGHDYLNKGFLQAVLMDGVRELGAAADAGKARLYATRYYTDLLETYHLFGDPALRVNTLVDVAVGLKISAPEAPVRGDLVTITLTFTNAGPGIESGVVLTDLLPSVLVTPTIVSSSPEVLAVREGITFAWTLDDLLPGAAGQIVLEATVDPHWPEPEVSFFNRAEIGVVTHDLVPQNNIAWVSVNPRKSYLPLVLRGF